MQLNVQSNITEIVQAIQNLEAKGQDLSPVFAEIANHLYNIADEAFENEVSPDGTPWASLKPATIKRKGHDRKLHQSGHLRETLSDDSDNNSATVGTHATSKGFAYPAVHQFGSEHITARPFLPFDKNGNLPTTVKSSIIEFVISYFQQQTT